jgi:hypothetical protein
MAKRPRAKPTCNFTVSSMNSNIKMVVLVTIKVKK